MKKLKYIIHRHHGKRLHYDLRLELEGVAKSWAIPKGLSIKEGEKRLAITYKDRSSTLPSSNAKIFQLTCVH